MPQAPPTSAECTQAGCRVFDDALNVQAGAKLLFTWDVTCAHVQQAGFIRSMVDACNEAMPLGLQGGIEEDGGRAPWCTDPIPRQDNSYHGELAHVQCLLGFVGTWHVGDEQAHGSPALLGQSALQLTYMVWPQLGAHEFTLHHQAHGRGANGQGAVQVDAAIIGTEGRALQLKSQMGQISRHLLLKHPSQVDIVLAGVQRGPIRWSRGKGRRRDVPRWGPSARPVQLMATN
jgi:hypothetical protein